MKIKFRQTGEGGVVDVVAPPAEEGGEESVVASYPLTAGQEVDVQLPSITDAAQIEVGTIVDTPPPEPAEPPADGGEGDQGGTTEEPPAPEEPKDTSEVPEGCAPGRIVTFRSAESGIDLAAVIGGTIASLPQAAIDSGDVPELTSPKRVHLTVISPFLGEDSKGGTFQAFNVPQAPSEIPEGEQIPNGTWRWPERV